jgi:uncharacterized repeat protein (TIGR03803 family)
MACIAVLFAFVWAISSPAQTLTTLVDFNGNNGNYPTLASPLVQGTDGNLYGVTYNGGTPANCFYRTGTGCGTFFKMTTTGELTSLYSFCSQSECPDGANPASLIQASDGNFYGVTVEGACPFAYDCGTAFKFTPSGQLTTLYTFCAQTNCSDGYQPEWMLQASDGNFYGVTARGGAYSNGTIFKITPAGKFTSVYSFCAQTGCPDGALPVSLIQASNLSLYGTSDGGGTYGAGTIFQISPSGTFTTLASLRKPNSVIQIGKYLYGTTSAGGSGDRGIVFRMTSSGGVANIHSFCPADCATGDSPMAGVVLGSDGNLYGSTEVAGNTSYAGSVYQITSTGTFNTLYLFCSLTNCADGDEAGSLMQDTNGDFYGITGFGGTTSNGTVYSLSMGLSPFVAARPNFASSGRPVTILGSGLTGSTSVTFNGVAATFTVNSDTYLTASVPAGATSGFITVTTPNVALHSNFAFQVVP